MNRRQQWTRATAITRDNPQVKRARKAYEQKKREAASKHQAITKQCTQAIDAILESSRKDHIRIKRGVVTAWGLYQREVWAAFKRREGPI